jgi:glucose-1-phosphate adenylyltransferase
MFEFAKKKDADLTIASLSVNETDAKRMGLLKIDDESYIKEFYEKPTTDELLKKFKLPDNFYEKFKTEKKPYLGSMGIYIFKRKVLENLLKEDPREDFGKHLIPTQITKGKTAAFVYDGYWEDIGTIRSYFEANLALSNLNHGLQIYDEKNPIYTRAHHLPGARINTKHLKDSIICEGCLIYAESIENSMIGLRSTIRNGSVLKNCVLLGNSSYKLINENINLPDVFEIGQNCILENCIIDEHVKIGNNVKLINKKKYSTYDSDGIYVRDNIIIITSGTIIKDNFEF